MSISASLPTLPLPYPGRRTGLPQLLRQGFLCLVESRPVVLVIFQLRFLTGVALGPSGLRHAFAAGPLAGALSWFCCVVFVYLFNGVTDVTEDQANASRRPIARGDLPVAVAARFAVAAAVLGLVLAAVVSVPMLLTSLGMLVLGYAYSGAPFGLKRTSSGTAVVVLLGGVLTYLAGWESTSTVLAPGRSLEIFALALSLWMCLVGATTKDLPDVEGDRVGGRCTTAVRRGDVWQCVQAGLGALVVGVAFLAVAELSDSTELIIPAFVVMAGAVAVSVACATIPGLTGRSQRRRPYRIFMVTQYLTHVAVIMTAVGLAVFSPLS